MLYCNVTSEREFSDLLSGRLVADNFVHMERNIQIHVLIIVEKGILNIEIGGTRCKVHPKEAVLLPANITHRGFRDEDTKGHIEYFWTHFLFRNKYELSETPGGSFSIPLKFKLKDYARVRILYTPLLDSYRLTGTRRKYCDFLCSALCCEIAAQFEYDTVSDNKLVNRAAAWIELNINRPISLEQTADALGYNKRYLARVFREVTGMTVNRFITKKKLALAKQYLTASDETISAVAASLGYDDAGYFMRLFKKHEGITCAQYRNAYSKMHLNCG